MVGNWRVVFCKSRQEARAQLHLSNQGYRVFLPRLRLHKRVRGRDQIRIEPMFPRYLFISLRNELQNWAPIRSTRGVVGLVRIGDTVPTVPVELIDDLRVRSDDHGVISWWDQQEPQINQPVEITAGPFAGYRGVYECRSGQQRAMILLDVLSRPQQIEVPMDHMRSV